MLPFAICQMITELLASIILQTNISSHVNGPVSNREDVVIERNFNVPTPRPFQFRNRTPRPTSTPKVTPTPEPSRTPKATATPKSSPAVQSVQTSVVTAQSVLQALNNYRSKNGVGSLQIDSKLQEYAQSRAEHLKSLGKLDKHAGHQEFMSNDGFGKLGFNAIAENQGYNYRGDAKGLIESFYGKSSGHNKNQLSSEYTHVGIGVSGAFTNLVFGGRRK